MPRSLRWLSAPDVDCYCRSQRKPTRRAYGRGKEQSLSWGKWVSSKTFAGNRWIHQIVQFIREYRRSFSLAANPHNQYDPARRHRTVLLLREK